MQGVKATQDDLQVRIFILTRSQRIKSAFGRERVTSYVNCRQLSSYSKRKDDERIKLKTSKVADDVSFDDLGRDIRDEGFLRDLNMIIFSSETSRGDMMLTYLIDGEQAVKSLFTAMLLHVRINALAITLPRHFSNSTTIGGPFSAWGLGVFPPPQP